MDRLPYWEEKPLDQMSETEWEALCDGCGRCCLIKLEDEDTGEILTSDVHCRLFDGQNCRCTDYQNRKARVPDCIKLTPDNVSKISWIPATCAYRRLAEGRGLAWWHPLVSGDPQTVVTAGISVAGRTESEEDIAPGEWLNRAVDWPALDPDEPAAPRKPNRQAKR